LIDSEKATLGMFWKLYVCNEKFYSSCHRCCSDGLKPAGAESSTLKGTSSSNKTTFAAITLVLGSLLAGQAFAADAATDTKVADRQAVAAKAADRKSTDAYADLDKIKKW